MKLDQLDLFAGPQARVHDPDTSHEAAAVAARGESARERLFRECFAAHGPMTVDELCHRLAEPERRWPTIRSHVTRLGARGVLVPTGETRLSDLGVAQRVWRWAA